MTETKIESPVPAPAPKPKPPPPPVTTAATAEYLRDLIQRMSPEERRRAVDIAGIDLPEEYAGVSLEDKVFAYRCKQCNSVAFDFLGNNPPPDNVPFERLYYVYSEGRYGSDAAWRRAQRRGRPRCQHCGQDVAQSQTHGVRRERIVHRERWLAQVNAQDRRRQRPVRSWERDAAATQPNGA